MGCYGWRSGVGSPWSVLGMRQHAFAGWFAVGSNNYGYNSS